MPSTEVKQGLHHVITNFLQKVTLISVKRIIRYQNLHPVLKLQLEIKQSVFSSLRSVHDTFSLLDFEEIKLAVLFPFLLLLQKSLNLLIPVASCLTRITVVGKPRLSTNKAKLGLTGALNNIAPRPSFYGLMTLWARLHAIHLYKLDGILCYLFPISIVKTLGISVAFVSTSGTNKIPTVLALNHIEQFFDLKHPIAFDTWPTLTNFDFFIMGAVRSTESRFKQRCYLWVFLTEWKDKFRRGKDLAVGVETRRKGIFVGIFQPVLDMLHPTFLTA